VSKGLVLFLQVSQSLVVCKKCQKWTWAGCGNHIESTLKGIPKEERCSCAEENTSSDDDHSGSEEKGDSQTCCIG
jgi:hypothetical protein